VLSLDGSKTPQEMPKTTPTTTTAGPVEGKRLLSFPTKNSSPPTTAPAPTTKRMPLALPRGLTEEEKAARERAVRAVTLWDRDPPLEE
jgi:hypothetical protein